MLSEIEFLVRLLDISKFQGIRVALSSPGSHTLILQLQFNHMALTQVVQDRIIATTVNGDINIITIKIKIKIKSAFIVMFTLKQDRINRFINITLGYTLKSKWRTAHMYQMCPSFFF